MILPPLQNPENLRKANTKKIAIHSPPTYPTPISAITKTITLYRRLLLHFSKVYKFFLEKIETKRVSPISTVLRAALTPAVLGLFSDTPGIPRILEIYRARSIGRADSDQSKHCSSITASDGYHIRKLSVVMIVVIHVHVLCRVLT